MNLRVSEILARSAAGPDVGNFASALATRPLDAVCLSISKEASPASTDDSEDTSSGLETAAATNDGLAVSAATARAAGGASVAGTPESAALAETVSSKPVKLNSTPFPADDGAVTESLAMVSTAVVATACPVTL